MFGQNPSIRSDAEIAVEFHAAVPSAYFRQLLKEQYSIVSVQTMLDYTGNIVIPSVDLEDIAGIEYAVNAARIDFQSNDLTGFIDVSAIVGTDRLHFLNNDLEGFGRLQLLDNLSLVYFSGNNIAQDEMEKIINDFWNNRATLGGNACTIRLDNNPGIAAAAGTMASEIADLTTAGCTMYVV